MSGRRTSGVVVAVGLGLLVTGCGKHYFGKPGASLTEFSQDSRECAQQHATQMSVDKMYGVVSTDLYRACLKQRGWARAQHPDPPPPGWFRGIEGDDEVVRLDAPPPQPTVGSEPRVPRCERGAVSATTRDSEGRLRCRP